MKVERKHFEINPMTFEVKVCYDVVDIIIDPFTNQGKEELDKIVKNNTITDILLSKFLQEHTEYKVIKDKRKEDFNEYIEMWK